MDQTPDAPQTPAQAILGPRSPIGHTEVEDTPCTPSPFAKPLGKGRLSAVANLASLYEPIQDGGSKTYIYETARVPSGDDKYCFSKHHPTQWQTLCVTQIYRVTYCLVRNVHPYFFAGSHGAFVKFDFLETIEPPKDKCSHMTYLLFVNRRTNNRLVLRMTPQRDLIGVMKLSVKDTWVIASIETLGGTLLDVRRLSSGKVWELPHVEYGFKVELMQQGMLSKLQNLKLISSINHPDGMPFIVWNPKGYIGKRVNGKTRVVPCVNRALTRFEAVDVEVITDMGGYEKIPIMEEFGIFNRRPNNDIDDSSMESESE